MLEVEVKIRADIDVVKGILLKEGYTLGSREYEKDIYYNGTHMDMHSQDKALRIREYRDEALGITRYILNFKGPKLDIISMSRPETEFEIPSFETGEAILNGLGFYAAGTVEKYREYLTNDDITCCLDTVTGLGDFLEVEIIASDDGYDAAMSRVREVIEKVGLDMADSLGTSYLSMLMGVQD